ncbi:MAG: TetR/AcrR family transcriptional regulator [Alphaproteobacteria bacterium]
MARRSRADMIAQTRAKLIAAGRRAFGEKGYAAASMDDFTAEAGLTRGALYHHFGDKKGLFEAVVGQIDAEMARRLKSLGADAPTRWDEFVRETVGYVELALDPEIQRILLRDGPAVLGDPSSWPGADGCIVAIRAQLEQLRAEGIIRSDIDADVAARLISGASTDAALWIANAADPSEASARTLPAFKALLEGLLAARAVAGEPLPAQSG